MAEAATWVTCIVVIVVAIRVVSPCWYYDICDSRGRDILDIRGATNLNARRANTDMLTRGDDAIIKARNVGMVHGPVRSIRHRRLEVHSLTGRSSVLVVGSHDVAGWLCVLALCKVESISEM